MRVAVVIKEMGGEAIDTTPVIMEERVTLALAAEAVEDGIPTPIQSGYKKRQPNTKPTSKQLIF